ncbi:MAG: S-layer homology domain-containing protein [Clostridia bacterium]|nr:S-layer homology domain-containing protein [Clostridia bacterium]
MRNLKKFFALVLAMLMIVSAAAVVSADDATFTDVAEENIYADAINDLVVKGITAGTGEGTFSPDAGVKRYEMAIFVARAATGITDVAEFGTPIVPFNDVTEYTGAIYYAYANGIVNGYSATQFGPDDAITYVQALKMAVATLGYEVEWEGDWKWPYYNKAVALGLTDGVDVNDLDKALTRGETAQIIANMIYAAPAEGDITLADKNFGSFENEVGVESTFVITATPKQAYVKDTQSDKYTAAGNAIDEVHVGIQALVNGVPTGAITYMPFADLVDDENADVEDYFNRAVTFINYDAETGAYDDVEVGAAPTVVNFKDIAHGVNGYSIKVNNVTYKLVSNLTGSYLNKEIVVFNSNVNAANTVGKNLLTTADGHIIYNGVIAAYLISTNTTAKFYVTVSDNKMIDEKTALNRYGYEIAGTEFDYADYAAMDQLPANADGVATTAYELHLYDDDKDGEYERAIYLPIYISSAYTYKSGSYTYDRVWLDATGTAAKVTEVKYNSDVELTTGTVFSFTYNELLKEITVNEVIEPETKTLKKLQYNKNTGKYTVTFTDGSSYLMDASDVELGGELLPKSIGTLKDPLIDDIKAGKYLGKTPVADLVDDRKIGAEYVFYATNGYIFFIEQTVAAKDAHEYMVFESIVDIDLDAVYASIWYDGAYKTGATISQVNAKISGVGDKAIEKLNAYQIALLLGDDTWQTKNTVWATQYADGQFNMRAPITPDMDDYADYDLIKLDDKTLGTIDEAEETLAFIGGHTVYDADHDDIEPKNRLYTNSNTVFYFIDTTGDVNAVEAYKTMPGKDASIVFDADTVIFTDALGRGNGYAKTVIVFDGKAVNFKALTVETRWLTTAGVSADRFVDASLTYAEDLGLTGYEEDLKVYAYAGAHDLEDGSETIIYSTFKLESGKIYKADKNGVVGVNAKGEKVAKSDLAVGVDYGTYKDFANTNGILYASTSLRDFYAYFNDGRVYVELGEAFSGNTEFPHTILIEGEVSVLAIPVTKLVAIDASNGTVYEDEDAAAVLNTEGEGADYDNVYWMGTRKLVDGAYEYDYASFEDGVAVFVFD